MNPGLLAILALLSLAILLFTGMPVAFCLLAISVLFTIIFLPSTALGTLAASVYGTMNQEVYLALPLFLIMAAFLENSGIAEDLFNVSYKWAGPLRGSLAVSTIIVCTILAAMTGIGATGVLTMGVVAYPQMIKYGYDKKIPLGVIPLGGALGPLIPPSNLMIILGSFTLLNVGYLFMAGVFPGLLISFITIAYILIITARNPALAPALPVEARATWREKFVSLRGLILPIILIFVVLGAIYTGATTVVEASGVGALGALICAAVRRRLTLTTIKKATVLTGQTTVMIYWLIIAGATYSAFLSTAGVGSFIGKWFMSLPIGTSGVIALLLAIIVILGMLMETVAIIMITVPVIFPLISLMGVEPIWFSTIYIMAVISGYITPPFGYNLFYLKSVVGERATMNEIFRAVMPYAIIWIVSLVIVSVFPELALWLPRLMGYTG